MLSTRHLVLVLGELASKADTEAVAERDGAEPVVLNKTRGPDTPSAENELGTI